MNLRQSHAEGVSVVGGSAAGFFTAYLLAQRRVPVRLFEQSPLLDPIARTLIVTSRFRDVLGRLGESSVINEIRRFELFTDGRSATVPLARPDLIIERATLIRSLAEHAQAHGAELRLGRKFVGLETHGAGLTLAFDRNGSGTERVPAQTVVAADGAFSRVAQAAGWPRQPTVPLVQAIVRLPEGFPADTTRIWFIPQHTPYFFWLIPESPTHAAVGLIGEDGQETRRHLAEFLREKGFAAESFQGARIPLYTGWIPVSRAVGAGQVYLVGDAAGHAKVTTVGGIVTGLRGAEGVAEAILNRGASRKLGALRRELDLHLWIRRALHRFTQADYSRLLDLLNAAARDSLSQHTRDDAGRILWRLCLNQPRLLLLGIRGLLTGGPIVRNPLDA